MKYLLATFAFALGLLLTTGATADQIYFEGFEDPGWAPGGNGWNDLSGGDVQRVVSGGGIAGVPSSSGNAHGQITNLSVGTDVFGNPSLGAGGPFTRFGGYSSTFGGGFSTSLDVYLDPAWSSGQGFDFSSAASRQDGSHLRDFIYHVGVVDDMLLVNASNNTDFNFNAFKLENENGGDNYEVTSAGWYTFEQEFRDDSGVLAVDFNLYDANGNLLYSVTRSSASDDIATTVGGNRYGWFTYNNIDGLAIDNTLLNVAAVPEPASILTWSVLGLGMIGYRTRRRRLANRNRCAQAEG